MPIHTRPVSPPPGPTVLSIRDDDLAHALSVLRTKPAAELSAIRNVRINFSEANVLHWHKSYWPGLDFAFDEEDMQTFERIHPVLQTSTLADNPPSQAFRAILRWIAENLDLGNLTLYINAGDASWTLFADRGAAAYATMDDMDHDWRFIYDWFLDVGRAVAEVFGGGGGLRELQIWTQVWDGMGAWLVGQITGRRTVIPEYTLMPRFQDPGMQLLSGKGVGEDGKGGGEEGKGGHEDGVEVKAD
ncbi:hypothetical protein VPNG_06374 [Cytospora leucostoma]|uniref:Uncharacterized protein n=1 Tax=Cytospora leucostoma TaxID=1230097 RepID=A0A423WYS5_9PEZI|nr:hypothetical protein VPNG_06374 [Cytospora leucostoma]